MKKYLFFDLDGTITDSGEGIRKCVQYALASFGMVEEDVDKLNLFIGPPLEVSFKKVYGFDNEKAWEGVHKYRERYETDGWKENKLYEGFEEVLKAAKAAGKTCVLATSKPEVFALRIIEYFGLTSYFDVMTGADLEGKHVSKDKVITTSLNRLSDLIFKQTGEKPDMDELIADSIMIGDRENDIWGAHQNAMESCGVRYGFAKPDELEDEGADYIVDTVAELAKFVAEI